MNERSNESGLPSIQITHECGSNLEAMIHDTLGHIKKVSAAVSMLMTKEATKG